MGGSIARRLLVLTCVSTLGVAAVTDAGNRLHGIQTASAPCNSYGGGTRIAVSPNGAHVYEYDRGCDSFRITVSARDTGTGQLTVVQTMDVPDPFCAFESHGMTVSPDGNHLYVHRGPRMYIFERNTGSGIVSGAGIVPLGNGATGPFQISPDGAHLYFVKRGSTYLYPDAVEVFARDAATGALTVAGEVLVWNVYDIAVSPDGAHLYVFTGPELYFLDEAVRTYSRDSGTGLLTPLGTTEISLGLGYGRLAVSGDGANVYLAANASGGSRLLTFARDAGTGSVTQIDDDALSTDLLDSSDGEAIAPVDEQIYLTVGRRLVAFDRSGLDGSLSFKEEHVDQVVGVPDGLTGVKGIAIPPDGAHVYTIGEGTVTFGRDGATGALTFLRNAEAEIGQPFLVGSPDGRHLYRWCTNTVVRFDRDGSTGLLTQSATSDLHSLGIGYAWGVRMAPDGEHIYVDDREGPDAVLDRDSVTGALNDVATSAVPFPNAFSPDGKNGYYFYGFNEGVGVLARDVTTGLLTSVGGGYSLRTAFDESDYVEGKDVVVSPDGSHVYVGARHGTHPRIAASIAAFARDTNTGALTLASTQRANGGGGGPFDNLWRLAPSADGTRLHAVLSGPTSLLTGESEVGGVASYSRNAGSGALAFGDALSTGAVLVWGGTLAVTPYGALLYALSDRGLQVLRSDPATGALGFVETVPEVPGGFGQVLSPDGQQLYVLLASGDVMVLANRPVCSATPASGCVAAAASTLKIAARVGAGDTVVWKWKATGAIDLGDPLASTEYAICVYDGSAAAQPVLSSGIPPGRVCGTKPCWTARATGYKYANRTGDPDGITTLRMASGASGSPSIALKGKGATLPPLALPYTVPITVQLQGSHGECWQASYTTATGNAGSLKARQ